MPLLPAFALIAFAFSSCGEPDPDTPAACLGGPAEIRQALAGAPGQVRLGGGVAISDCLPRNQAAGPQQSVGRSLVLVAGKLAAAANGPGESEAAALQAGYLVGALKRGAEDSEGIHATLVERVSSAATNRLKRSTGEVRAAYGRGLAAGLEGG